MYNIVFLDFDGVLNCKYTKEQFKGWAGLEDEKLNLLKELVVPTKSIIVLTTSWRMSWDYKSHNDNIQSIGRYISDKFKAAGILERLKLKTDSLGSRGIEIYQWLEKYPHGNWVVLDDDVWDDFEQYQIYDHLVRTDYDKGLTVMDIQKAKNILYDGTIV